MTTPTPHLTLTQPDVCKMFATGLKEVNKTDLGWEKKEKM